MSTYLIFSLLWGLNMIVYEVEPVQTDYLLQENIKLNLKIHNRGSQPVVVPDPSRAANSQPVYGLAGPGFPEPLMFSNFTRHDHGQPPPPLQLTTIAPGETWNGESRLNRLVTIDTPGDYRIASMLAWQEIRVRAQDQSFRVNRPHPVSLHIGQGQRPFNHAQGQIVFLQRETASTGVYSIQFDESDPANSEIELRPTLRRATAGAHATDVLSPWTNTQLFHDLLQWIVWREGRSLKALSSAETSPTSFEFPVEPDFLVRPPLQPAGGPVEVLAVKGSSLSMVSIAPHLESKPAFAWRAELPAPPFIITAALGPVAGGSTRHIVFAVRHGDSTSLFHALYTASGLGPMESVPLPDGHLLEKVPLTVAVTEDGVVHAAAIQTSDGGKVLSLVEVQFGMGKPPQVAARPLPLLEKPPVEGTVLYVMVKGAISRREVVLSSDGDLWNLASSGQFTKIAPRRAFVSPVCVVAGLELSYLLYQDANGAFQFVPLNR